MVAEGNVGVAFGLVIGAGISTAIGAAVVFFPALVKLASPRILAGSLGLSAGVMTYVSFIEIFQKSVGSFEDSGKSESKAKLYATLCFFGGVLIMLLLNIVVHKLLGGHHHHHHDNNQLHSTEAIASEQENRGKDSVSDSDCRPDEVDMSPPCCSDDPTAQMENYKKIAAKIEETDKKERGNVAENENNDEQELDQAENQAPSSDRPKDTPENRRLSQMGVNTALAIGLHNFPEGLATFVAALEDARVGAILAIAIGIHNIPEGLCVALPIYYATGDRLKAFSWALVSGVSEPVAALLGWAILASTFSDGLYATLFGIVSGMMVVISIRELIPTAHNYDPKDTVVTYSFIVGMVIMALSLVLFEI